MYLSVPRHTWFAYSQRQRYGLTNTDDKLLCINVTANKKKEISFFHFLPSEKEKSRLSKRKSVVQVGQSTWPIINIVWLVHIWELITEVTKITTKSSILFFIFYFHSRKNSKILKSKQKSGVFTITKPTIYLRKYKNELKSNEF